jgi:hypothetical protein
MKCRPGADLYSSSLAQPLLGQRNLQSKKDTIYIEYKSFVWETSSKGDLTCNQCNISLTGLKWTSIPGGRPEWLTQSSRYVRFMPSCTARDLIKQTQRESQEK